MRVKLKEWMRQNAAYVAIWIFMGLTLLALVIREIGIYTLVVIAPFLPPFIIAMVKMAKELRKR
ncbi:MAG: hypothetical protein ACP5PX_02245 [Candidatus Hadarchaeum sp.]|uniref:hypothetical protein n=1 Tax=Candidatus Hadarchaeum sp. TaxID=2883567 RepID=UPI003D0C8EF6